MRKTRAWPVLTALWACFLVTLLACWAGAEAQEPEKDTARETGWSNTTDLGLSATDGNSETEAFKIHNLLRWRSERASFRMKLEGLRTDTTGDRYRRVDPGFSWEPGATPPEVASVLVDPDQEPDVEKYYVEARYERLLSKEPLLLPGAMSWHGGVSWDRNLDAGLRSRLVAFSGLGRTWWEREDLKFHTILGLSWTDRHEVVSDVEKEESFAGLRYNWLYENRWGKHVTFHNDWTFNVRLEDLSDYSSTMTSSIRVPTGKRMSLSVSLQWLYNSVPAFEDINVVAQVIFVDPDGIPGNGDELIQTVESGGTRLEVGSTLEQKKKLDTIFTTSLAISF